MHATPLPARPGAGRPVRRWSRTALLSAGVMGAALLPLLPPGAAAAAPAPPPPTVAEGTFTAATHTAPYRDPHLPVEQRVEDLLIRMTLEEKVGQMTQAERGDVDDDPSLIAEWRLGSVLSGGGSTPAENTPEAWVEMVNSFQEQALSTRLGIPLIYGVDAVHGHGNVRGATIFPHNIGLGATRDPGLVERTHHATATEVRATGIPWNFAPCVCVTRDERWGRSYESFSEDPALVVRMETAIDGLQGTSREQLDDPDRVLATVKHYAGDGDTAFGTGAGSNNPGQIGPYTVDQGVTVTNRVDFERIDLAPYRPAVGEHDAGSVMPSFSSVDWTEDGVGNPIKMHANEELITDVLKGDMGFDGFVISDWLGIHQIPGDYPAQVRAGVNAGIDMMMEPGFAEDFIATLLVEVEAGRVSEERIDDAVRRILTKKFELGLFENPYASTDNVDEVGSPAHRAVAREAAAESQVLLKNAGGVLPLRRDARLYVAGRNADDMGNQNGGWTITWQGFSGNENQQPGTTILEGIREVAPGAQVTYSADASAPTEGSDIGVAVVGETPYSEGFGDVGGPEWGFDPADAGQLREEKSLSLLAEDRAVVDKVCSAFARCVVLVVSGRTQVLSDQLGQIDGLVASWLPGTEGGGVADVLFGRRPFTGQLPVTWPRSEEQVPINVGDAEYDPQYPFGWGLRTDSARQRLRTEVQAVERTDPRVRRGANQLTLALSTRNWRLDGTVANEARVVGLINRAVANLQASEADTSALQSAAVSVVRDLAQAAMVADRAPEDAARLFAEADHALVVGDADEAVALLAQVAGVGSRL